MRLGFTIIALAISCFLPGAHCADRSPGTSAYAAAEFIATLSKNLPTHDGVPLRDYFIQDLDHDGKFEVLERICHFEPNCEFLNTEIGPAFDWINIYREKNGRFVEATGEFGWFLSKRKEHYLFWQRVFNNPSPLYPDSLNLLRTNRTGFNKALKELIFRVEKLSR